jgi:hypothetical protein
MDGPLSAETSMAAEQLGAASRLGLKAGRIIKGTTARMRKSLKERSYGSLCKI